MIDYIYEHLGDDRFQRLVQTLLLETHPGLTPLPLNQADGGRDALDGRVVYQMKYSDSHSRRDAAKWMISAIDAEEPAIRQLVARGLKHYYIVTNVRGSSTLDSGAIDLVRDHLDQLKINVGLESADAWWRDSVDIRLNKAPNATKLTFLDALPASAILSLGLMEASPALRADRCITRVLDAQADSNKDVRFKQVNLASTDLTSLFVDVPIAATDAQSNAALLIQRSLEGAGQSVAQATLVGSVGAAKLFLEQPWRGHAVIIGGPGQGKTTLLQYVTQAHRAAQLRRTEGQHNGLLLPRIPLTVDLRDFALWFATKRKKPSSKKKPISLDAYVCQLIGQLSGGQSYSLDDWVSLLARQPVLLALDGLDEVADLDLRDDIAKEIASAATRTQAALDLSIVVTTRPGASTAPDLLGPKFQALVLQPLNPVLRQEYLRKWATQIDIDSESVQSLSNALTENEIKPHVRDLGSNPMQLAILLHLLYRKGHLPEQRTALYSAYVDIFFEREAPKDPVITDNSEIIKEVHGYLAYRLQCMAEQASHDGRLNLSELHTIIDPFLWARTDKAEVVAALFAAVTNRVICLVQRVSNTFEFEVQPLREYFAAWHLFETADPHSALDSRDDRLEALAIRPYWSNVLRFYVGLQTRGEVRGMLRNYKRIDEHAGLVQTSYTQNLIFTLFSDLAYQQQYPADRREAIDYALGGARAHLAADGLVTGRLASLPTSAGREEVISHCLSRLLGAPEASDISALATILNHHGFSDVDWLWSEPAMGLPADTWLPVMGEVESRPPTNAVEFRHLDAMVCQAQLGHLNSGNFGSLADPSPTAEAQLNKYWSLGQDGPVPDLSDTGPAASLELLLSFDTALLETGRAISPTPELTTQQVTGRTRRRVHRGGVISVRLKRLEDAINRHRDDSRVSKYVDLVSEIDRAVPGSPRVAQWLLAAPLSWATLLQANAVSRLTEPGRQLADFLPLIEENAANVAWWTTQLTTATLNPGSRLLLCAHFVISAKSRVVSALLSDFEALVAKLPAPEFRVLHFTIERMALGRPGRQLDIAMALRNRSTQKTRPALLLQPVVHDSTRSELSRLVRDDPEDALLLGGRTAQAWLDLRINSITLKNLTLTQLRNTREAVRGVDLPIASAPSKAECKVILTSPAEWPTQAVMGANAIELRDLASLESLATIAARDQWSAELT